MEVISIDSRFAYLLSMGGPQFGLTSQTTSLLSKVNKKDKDYCLLTSGLKIEALLWSVSQSL